MNDYHHCKETRYKTDAEKFGNSYVFDMCLEKEVLEASTQAVQVAPWWIQIDGASWKSPEGGKESVTDILPILLIDLFIGSMFFAIRFIGI